MNLKFLFSNCKKNLNRIPQPQFLGALVQFFTRSEHINDDPASNITVIESTIPEKTTPFLFGALLSYIRETFPDYAGDMFEAYFYAAAVVAASAFNVMLMHPYLLSQLHLGMKMRVAMCSMIYRKSLRLSKNALGETTVGQVVNLLSNDVGRLDLAIIFLHFLWVGPLETIIVTYLMYLEVSECAARHVLDFIKLKCELFFIDWHFGSIRCYIYVDVHSISSVFR